MTTSKISTLYKSILHYKLTFVGFESQKIYVPLQIISNIKDLTLICL